MSSDNTSQHYWNTILAKAGLHVWAGSSHHLVYFVDFNRPPEHDQQRVKLGGAGESQTSMFLELALFALTKRDQVFLEHYQSKTVSEVAAFYNITRAAVYCRIARLRQKLSHTARLLKNR